MSDVQSVTVVELKALCEQVLAKRKLTDEAEDVYKKLYHECDELEQKLVTTMTELGMKDFRESGMLFLVKKTSSIVTPKDENKEVFFNYLKSIGHFDALISVNSRTLNSWYNQEAEAAKNRGEMLMIPGLELPTERVGLSIRKSNK